MMQRSLTYMMVRVIALAMGGALLHPATASAVPLSDLTTRGELSIAEMITLAGSSVRPQAATAAQLKSKDHLPVWNTADTKAAPEMTVAELISYRPQTAPAQATPTVVAKKSSDKFAPTSAMEIAGVQIRVYAAEPVKAAKPATAPEVIAAPAATSVVTAAPVETKTFTVRVGKKATKLSPDALHFEKSGDKIQVVIDYGKTQQQTPIQIFVRDQAVLAWNQPSATLEAKKTGTSELYVVVGGAMRIVPVFVGKTDSKGFELPDKLASIDGLMPQPNYESARFSGLDKQQPETPAANDDEESEEYSENAEIVANAEREIAEAIASEDAANGTNDQAAATAKEATTKGALSLQDSAAEAARTMAADAEEQVRYTREINAVSYTKVSLQIVDERSRPEQGVIYPVIGAQVHIVGTEFVATSDGTGHVVLSDLPRASRFLVNVRHPNGDVRPTIAEVATPASGNLGVIRLKVMRHDSFDNFAAMVRTSQRADTASLCVTIQAGYTASLDVAAEGPAHFNQYGFIDPAAQAAGPDGRACFFNVDPGPILLQIKNGATAVGNAVLAVYPGMHTEETLNIADVHDFEVGLGIIATAAEQLGSDRTVADGWRSIDTANIVPVGDSQPMRFVRDGIVAMNDEFAPGGRRWFTTQTGEFEPSVQALDRAQRRRDGSVILPLVPRGFVEDISVFAQVNYDQSLGAVMVEHGHLQGQGQTPVSVRLLNESGAEVGEGWYFSDQPTTKAIFFNVPPGRYALLVETNDRYWLAADTLVVYSETLTIVQTGNRALLKGN